MTRKEHGYDRRVKTEPLHVWRWRALMLWIAIFTLVVIWSIHDVKDSRAKVTALEHTNCRLKIFMLTARHARLVAAKTEYANVRKTDLKAAHAYKVLADSFTAIGKNCEVPKGIND